MSISLGPDDLGYLPPSPPPYSTNYLARRRTVSTSFEQVRHDKVHIQVREIVIVMVMLVMVMVFMMV